jgi:glutaredoxin
VTRLVAPTSTWSKRAVIAVAAMLSLVLAGLAAGQESPAGAPSAGERFPVNVYLFWGQGCPHCETQKRFLATLRDRYPTMEVRLFEVWYDAANRELMQEMAGAFGRTVSAVPMTFIGDEAWVGFSDAIGRQMVASIEAYERYRGPDPIDRLGAERRAEFAPAPPPEATLTLPLVGTLDLVHRPLLVGTFLVALVDGFNPCSLWVLALLLGIVVNTRSRRRVMLVGLVFLSVTALAYGLFIAGLFSVLSYLPYLTWIRVAVALIALAFALINIKDYVAYKRGISLTIDDAHKPTLYRRIRNVMNQRGSVPATVLATATLALGITLVELPCTAGLPVLWTSLVADAGVGAGVFAGLLTVYMVVYLLDELAIFAVAVVTMRVARFEEREGRVLKLVGGSVMLALAAAMLFRPTALESVGGMLMVFGLALGASLLVAFTHYLVHPASSPLRRAAQ